ncbi:MAG: hypothetical protein ACO1RT_08180 [Planctomycetaceae bacterium]
MQQIKIFKSIESERDQMEKDINRWMRKSGARVISITGNISANTPVSQAMSSFSGNDILIIVLYEIDLPAS